MSPDHCHRMAPTSDVVGVNLKNDPLTDVSMFPTQNEMTPVLAVTFTELMRTPVPDGMATPNVVDNMATVV